MTLASDVGSEPEYAAGSLNGISDLNTLPMSFELNENSVGLYVSEDHNM